MFGRLFPRQIDNTYRGYWFAIWLLVPIVLMKAFMGLNVAGFNPWVSNRDVLKGADGVPIDTFGAEVASLVVFLFASWGLALLLLSLLGLVALIRYRAMVPLVYLLLLAEQVGRKGIATFNPIVRAVEADAFSIAVMINWGFTAALVVGLILSLATPRGAGASETVGAPL